MKKAIAAVSLFSGAGGLDIASVLAGISVISSKVVLLRDLYPYGTIVELVKSNDNTIHLKPGDRGIVDHIDDAGQIHICWNNQLQLALIPYEDQFKVIP